MKAKDKSAAIVTVFDAPSMTPKGRRAIATWLKHVAAGLVKDGTLYAEKRFTARYLYR